MLTAMFIVGSMSICALILMYTRMDWWRTYAHSLREQLRQAEEGRAKTATDLHYLKEMFSKIFAPERPIVATLSEQQVENVIHAILAYAEAVTKEPKELD